MGVRGRRRVSEKAKVTQNGLFEQFIIGEAVVNSEAWFGKKLSRELIEDRYFPFLKVGKNSAKSIMKYDTKYFASTCPLAGDHLVQISEKEKNKDLKELKEPSHPIELIALAYNFNNK